MVSKKYVDKSLMELAKELVEVNNKDFDNVGKDIDMIIERLNGQRDGLRAVMDYLGIELKVNPGHITEPKTVAVKKTIKKGKK